MVEEYLPGPEYSVETFDADVVGITHKHLGREPDFLEVGHDFPAPLGAAEQAELGGTAVAALRALGLGWGPAHVELRRTPAGPRVVEVNPRLAGGMIPEMVQQATGIDLIRQTVARVTGRETSLRRVRARAASIRFLVAETAGHLVEVRGAAEAAQVPGVVSVGLIREPGQDLVLRRSFQDRLAYVIATGTDGAAAARAAEAGRQALQARIVPSRSGQAVSR